MKQGQPARVDYEYERNGTANLFMMFAPLEGWRRVKVTDRRTAVDFAHALKDLSDIHFPDAKQIVLVQDNFNTHKKASLYEAFPAAEARRLVERFEWHYTPKHGRGPCRCAGADAGGAIRREPLDAGTMASSASASADDHMTVPVEWSAARPFTAKARWPRSWGSRKVFRLRLNLTTTGCHKQQYGAINNDGPRLLVVATPEDSLIVGRRLRKNSACIGNASDALDE